MLKPLQNMCSLCLLILPLYFDYSTFKAKTNKDAKCLSCFLNFINEMYLAVVPSSGIDMSPFIPPQQLWPMTTIFSTCKSISFRLLTTFLKKGTHYLHLTISIIPSPPIIQLLLPLFWRTETRITRTSLLSNSQEIEKLNYQKEWLWILRSSSTAKSKVWR